jgi:hypothetical protein
MTERKEKKIEDSKKNRIQILAEQNISSSFKLNIGKLDQKSQNLSTKLLFLAKSSFNLTSPNLT